MARLLSCSTTATESLDDGWECTSLPSGAAACPRDIDAGHAWYPACVPGTFAAAMRDAGEWNGDTPLELDHLDIWYRTSFVSEGDERLCFVGLATIADVWLNSRHALHSDNMFRPHQIDIDGAGIHDLYICFRSLTEWLQRQRGRARWRTRIATPSTLRFARTTLLGRMPGWCPTVHPVGPWRPILRKRRKRAFEICAVDARVSVDEGCGRVALRCWLNGEIPADLVAGAEVGCFTGGLRRKASNEFAGDVIVPNVALWWPHTHGTPRQYQVTVRFGHDHCDLGQIGFRTIETDLDTDRQGFGLSVNGETIFCRGACWTTPDVVALPCAAASYRPWLEAMRDAGMNMVRIAGTMVYEADEFYACCDALGLLVWQDAMLANFDYPATTEFQASLSAEIEHFLDRTQLSASLAVFCGGSEVLQQAAMQGLAPDRTDTDLYHRIIPEVVSRVRPGLQYVANSPNGGDLPFLTYAGVAHYYGVGAYLRPLVDGRLAGVRFASECLAVANVPCSETVQLLGTHSTTDPRWKRAVPRDPGAGWDFDDVRDRYLAMLFGEDPCLLRSTDFDHYLELSRAVSCILMENVFNDWRRVGSICRGGLVWQWQDVMPGAGWGVIDSRGRRKPAWYALQRAGRKRQVILTDEGLNGLEAHIVNETAAPLHAILELVCLKDGMIPVRKAEQPVTVAPRSALRLSSAALLYGFFDITYAYRFGPRVHDATVAILRDAETGDLIADAWHFPDIAALRRKDIGLEVTVERSDESWTLQLLSQHFALFLHIDDFSFISCENWLHLPPGRVRRIALLPTGNRDELPRGEVRALNMDRVVQYTGRA